MVFKMLWNNFSSTPNSKTNLTHSCQVRCPMAPICTSKTTTQLWRLRLDIKILFSKFQSYAMMLTFIRVSLYKTTPLWEVNFSKLFFYFSECSFRFLLKKCVYKLFLLFQNSNWNIVKNQKYWKIWVSSKRSDLKVFLQFWPCSHWNF